MISTQISPDVAALVTCLIDSKPGDLVTHAALSSALGRDAREQRFLVLKAIRLANKEHGAMFASVRGEGYQRLHPEEAHTVGATARTSIRRKAGKAIRTIVNGISRTNDMAPEARQKVNAELTILNLVRHTSRDAQAKPNEHHISSPEPLAIAAQRLLQQMGKVG